MTYSLQSIGERLRTARQQKRWSQRALADATGLPQSHISKIENGAIDLRLSSLLELARNLDMELVLVPRKNLTAVQALSQQSAGSAKDEKFEASEERVILKLRKDYLRFLDRHFSEKEGFEYFQMSEMGPALTPEYIEGTGLGAVHHYLTRLKGTPDYQNEVEDLLHQVSDVKKILTAQKRREVIGTIGPAYTLDEDDAS